MVSEEWQNKYLKVISSTDNTNYVQINDIRSDIITTNIGVPQGSVLEPLLINKYINDLLKPKNNVDTINYADDTTLISPINQFDNHSTGMNGNINKELRNIHNWLLEQWLSLNVKKMMMFHMPQKCSFSEIINIHPKE